MDAQSEQTNPEETDERTTTSSNDGEGGGGDADNSDETPKPASTKRFCAASETSDPIRLKCRKMLTDALKTPRTLAE